MKILKLLTVVTMVTTLLNASKSVIINLSTQKIYAKENGYTLFSGNISSGMQGHRTPRGTYKILEKDRYHISNLYPEPDGGATMPYMLRLTNGGIAIHQGYLPGYPASHGCIRVTKRTALKLWRWAKIGTRVTIIGSAVDFEYAQRKKRTKKKKYYSKVKKYKKSKKVRKSKHKVQRLARNSRNRCSRSDDLMEYKIVEIYDSY